MSVEKNEEESKHRLVQKDFLNKLLEESSPHSQLTLRISEVSHNLKDAIKNIEGVMRLIANSNKIQLYLKERKIDPAALFHSLNRRRRHILTVKETHEYLVFGERADFGLADIKFSNDS